MWISLQTPAGSTCHHCHEQATPDNPIVSLSLAALEDSDILRLCLICLKNVHDLLYEKMRREEIRARKLNTKEKGTNEL